jgi:hypothetical protein
MSLRHRDASGGHRPIFVSRGDMSAAEIIAGLREAYHEFGRPDVWAVAEKWLARHGISDH